MMRFRAAKIQPSQHLSRQRLTFFAGIFTLLGITVVAFTLAASVSTMFEPENGTLANGATVVTNSGASGGKAIKLTAASTPTPTPTPTSTPSSPTSYVQPGTVGYLGNVSVLTVINSQATIPANLTSSCRWDASDGLRCDSANVTMDHVYIKGGIYWTGNGTLTITNSIIEGGKSWFVIVAQATTGHPTVAVSDSTLRWPSGVAYPTGFDAGVVTDGSGVGVKMLMYRDDISGMPQGIDPDYDNSVIDSCWIHNLTHTGSQANGTDTHVDGIFSQGGNNLTISHNYIDVADQGNWATAAIFFQDLGGTTTGYKVTNNYMVGGSYTYYNETALSVDVQNNTIGPGVYGNVAVTAPGTTGLWSGNVQPNGAAIPRPSR